MPKDISKHKSKPIRVLRLRQGDGAEVRLLVHNYMGQNYIGHNYILMALKYDSWSITT